MDAAEAIRDGLLANTTVTDIKFAWFFSLFIVGFVANTRWWFGIPVSMTTSWVSLGPPPLPTFCAATAASSRLRSLLLLRVVYGLAAEIAMSRLDLNVLKDSGVEKLAGGLASNSTLSSLT
jgi:hypothetical protein